MFRGGVHETIKDKLTKIVESFGSSRFDFPTNPEDYEREIKEVEEQYDEIMETVNLTKTHIESVISSLNEQRFDCSILEANRLFLLKEKYIYTILNYFKQADNRVIIMKCWCADASLKAVEEALKSCSKLENIPTLEVKEQDSFGKPLNPPSHFQSNDFINPFQEIVNTYGIPRYQEINPGLFTIISFPFLFGVMFGDIGHGLALMAFGTFLSFSSVESMKSIAKFRYLILLMGFFSVFCGFIYNEIFSIHLNLFGSCYLTSEKHAAREEDCTYAFGIDPVWGVATNELAFYNSFKMKLAVILGVLQMTLGIFLKGFNTIKTSNTLDFFFEFLPQLLFMSMTFLYLDTMIIIKWLTDWDHGSIVPPSLIEQFLNLALKLGGVEGDPLYGEGNHQMHVQEILFTLAILAVPWMLFTKPLIIYSLRKTAAKEEAKGRKIPFRKRSSGLDIMIPMEEKKSIEEDKQKSMEEDKEKKEVKETTKHEEVIHESEHEHEEGKGESETDSFIPKDDSKLQKILTEHRDFQSDSEEADDKHEPMSEIIVHQIIETIEFVLGSISNTASYLRLWALSLAHSQLSKVFFEKTIMSSVEEKSFVGLIIGYFLFINITFAVLMCMDVMECFLHALRLHWVEFQNKFFKADGYKFVPMSFEELLRNELEK